MKTRQLQALALLVGLLLVPMAANAESHEMGPEPLTWLSYVQAQPGQSGPLTQNLAKNGAKIYDGLMADGHILSWGVTMPVNHRAGDDWNVMEWVTFRDWAAVDSFMQAFMAAQMAKSPEEMMAEQKEWQSLVVPGSHHDEIVRHQVYSVSGETRPAYINLGYQTARPGKGQALAKQYKEWGDPTMKKLLEAGAITGYGFATPAVHGGGNGTHILWYAMSNLAARDAVSAGFDAAAEARGPEAQKEAMTKFAETVDITAHHDRIFMIVHLGGGGGDGDGDGGE